MRNKITLFQIINNLCFDFFVYFKQGAARKGRDSSRRSKKDEKVALHSETQRMVRGME